MKWTDALHSNFMDCVADLGGKIENATASEILRRMLIREPGLELTESQVRSHLQKIRNFKTKKLKRMNTKARIHQQYLLQTSLWGTRAVLDEWGFFLRECDNLYRSIYDDDDDNDNDISDSENNNQQVEMILQNHSLLLGENEDNNPLLYPPMVYGDNIRQDTSGGNYMGNNTNNFGLQLNVDQCLPTQVDYHDLLFGENNNNSYSKQVGQQQLYNNTIEQDSSVNDNHMVDFGTTTLLYNTTVGHNNLGCNYMGNADNQLNIDHHQRHDLIPIQQFGNRYAMGYNHNGSAAYSLCGSQPSVQVIPSTAPTPMLPQHINSYGPLHDSVETSSHQQSLNQHCSSPPQTNGDNNEEWKAWIASPERSELDAWMERMMDDYPPKI